MSVVRAPRRVPLLGNLPQLAVGRVDYLQSLRALGDIVEIAIGTKSFYLLNSPEAIRQVLVVDGDRYDKGALFDNLTPFLGNGVMTCSRAEHREQRRAIQPAFSKAALVKYAGYMAETAEKGLTGFRDGRVIDVPEEMRRLTGIVMCKVVFGADGVDEVPHQILRSLPALVDGVLWRTVLPPGVMSRLPIPANRRYDAVADTIRRTVRDVVGRYREEGVDHGDLLSSLIAARNHDGVPLSDVEITDQVVTILLAGSESTASVLSWLFHVLDSTPSVEGALLDEIEAVVGERTPDLDDLARMPYLRNVLWETLRLHNPVWFTTRRSTGPVSVVGVDLPGGTDFIYSIATLHRDGGLFEAPDEFRPDRWETSTPARGAYIPFSAGSRKCVGDDFAVNEMSLVLITILRRWALRRVDDRPVEAGASIVINPKRLVMRLVRR